MSMWFARPLEGLEQSRVGDGVLMGGGMVGEGGGWVRRERLRGGEGKMKKQGI